MPPLWWAWMLFGPAIAAAAGALTVHLAHHRRCELLQDRAYEDGWRDGRNKAEAYASSMVPEARTMILHPPPQPRHAQPRAASPATMAAVAVLAVRSEFDRIRLMFGLDGIEGPARSRAAELHHGPDIAAPPSGELLRAAGIDAGPPWPTAARPE